MTKFDLKKIIAENKATFFSSLDEGYDEFKRAEKGSKDVTAKDKGEEDVYGAGVEAGEKIEKEKLSEGSASSFKEWLEGIQNVSPKVANDFEKYPDLKKVSSKEEFIKLAKEIGELYDESETKTEYKLGNTIYVSEYPITGIKSISLSSGLDSYGRYTDETNNRLSTETPEQARNRVYPLGSRMDENKPTTKITKSELKEYEVIYYYEGSKCMSRNDEGEVMQVSMDKCRRFAQNENKPITKMTKEALKTKIKEMILAELNEENIDVTGLDYNFYNESKLAEAKKEDEEATDAPEATDVEVSAEETPTSDSFEVSTSEVDPTIKAIQDALTQAQAAAQKLGDEKLTDQIGNTITFFTRTHVANKDVAPVAEELDEAFINKMKHRAGIIK